jgi:hypothetical protein
MHGERKSTLLLLFLMVGAGVALAVTFAPRLHAAGPQPDAAIIAEGGGTTIIQGGTGAPGGGCSRSHQTRLSRRADRCWRHGGVRVSGSRTRGADRTSQRTVHGECNVRHGARQRSDSGRRYRNPDGYGRRDRLGCGEQRVIYFCGTKGWARGDLRPYCQRFDVSRSAPGGRLSG